MSLKLKYAWEKLSQNEWFEKTPKKVKDTLSKMGESFLGYLIELGHLRIDPNKEILSIKSVDHSEKIVITTLQIRSTLTNEVFEEERVSLNNGEDSLNYGMILLENYSSQIKDIVLLEGGPIQMHFPSFSTAKTIALPKRIETKLKKYLGAKTVVVKRYIDLGKFSLGVNFLKNDIKLFALVISREECAAIKNTDSIVQPVTRVAEIMTTVDNILTLAILNKLKTLRIITY